MKITLITGSPRRDGASSCLAESFVQGAKEAGNEVFRFDAGLSKVAPCTACEVCHDGRHSSCIYHDGMDLLMPHLDACDALVLVSPIYYYDMTPQIRTVIGRFYGNREAMHRKRISALLLVCGDKDAASAAGAAACYRTLIRHYRWEDAGVLTAVGCTTREDILRSGYLEEARVLGRNL